MSWSIEVLPLTRPRLRPTPRRGSTAAFIISALVLAALVILGLMVYPDSDGSSRGQAEDLFTVQRGDFSITIPASGELLAQEQIEVRNRLESRAEITEIIDEGTYVEEGDVLLRLNDEELRNRIKDEEDSVNTARSSLISAEATLAIRQSQRDSDIDRAELDLRLAVLALEAWEKGELEARLQQLELAVESAQTNYDRLEQRVKDSERLYDREFISKDELERDRIEKIEAEARLAQAKKDLEVYKSYTYHQEKEQKQSDVSQARAELDRVRQRHEAEIETARADVHSRTFQLESREERLADLQQQLEYTTVKAPSAGLVVYSSSLESRRRGSDEPPDVGTTLSRNELVMLLPDTSRMIASVKVNEALSGLIEPGQRASVSTEAVSDVVFEGEVQSIGVLAESGGWRDPNRRDYTVRILMNDTDGLGLRPSMRARANIHVDQVENALHIPVQSVFREGRNAFVYVPQTDGYASHSVRIGRSSELYVEVLDGLEEGTRVLLRRPQSGEVIREDRQLHEEAETIGNPQEEEIAQR